MNGHRKFDAWDQDGKKYDVVSIIREDRNEGKMEKGMIRWEGRRYAHLLEVGSGGEDFVDEVLDRKDIEFA